MNLQQFRFLREAARHKFNITAAARALHTSQPGVSKAIIELEGELGVSILARQGKRILGLTSPGQQVLLAAERIMQEVDNLKNFRATTPVRRRARCVSRRRIRRRVTCCPRSCASSPRSFRRCG
jgi:DNA-binding transcriptional LysR family regulator